MRREEAGSAFCSDEEEVTERTSLVRHSSASGAYRDFGASSDRIGAVQDSSSAACVREQHMRTFYRETFVTTGIDITLKDVTLIQHHRFNRWLRCVLPSRAVCESATAVLAKGKLNVIACVDDEAASALSQAISGERPCDMGEIAVDGGLVPADRFRRTFGMVTRTPAAVPTLSVARNLRFSLDMRTRGNCAWKRSMIQSTSAFVQLREQQKVCELGPADQFSLRLAMGLVLDPPVIVVENPFDDLDFVSRLQVASLLRATSAILRKTVVVCTTSLPSLLFDRADTILLCGRGGRVLFSGPSYSMTTYFNCLHIPRHRTAPTLQHDDTPSAELRANAGKDSPTSSKSDISARIDVSPSSRERLLSLSSPTPARISSHLFANDGDALSDVTSISNLLLGRAAVEVSSGEEAFDLAVEWADSEAQTMFYAAKFYDSTDRRTLLAAVDAAALSRLRVDATDESSSVLTAGRFQVADPQYGARKPFILLMHILHQMFAEREAAIGSVGLLVGVLSVSLLMHFQPQDQGGMYNIRGILFMLFSMVLLANEATMSDISKQLKRFVHQRNSGLYTTSCFVVCLVVRVVLVRSVYLVLLVPFVLSVVKASKGVVALVGFVSVSHALLLYLVHAVAPSERLAAWGAHAYFGLSLACSGFLLNLTTIPVFLGDLSVVRWAYGPSLKERLVGKGFQCDGAHNTSYCYTGKAYLKMAGLTDDSFELSFTVLTALSLGLLAALWITLALR